MPPKKDSKDKKGGDKKGEDKKEGGKKGGYKGSKGRGEDYVRPDDGDDQKGPEDRPETAA